MSQPQGPADRATGALVVEDPVLGQRYHLTREGNVLRNELWADAGAGVPEHFHPTIEERFQVLEGEFTFSVGGKKVRAGPGDKLVVEAGVRHSFENTGQGPGHFVAEIEPALDMQQFFEESAALARAGKYTRRGTPRGFRAALELAEFTDRYRDTVVMTFPPQPIQRLLIPPLARFERRRRARRGPAAG